MLIYIILLAVNVLIGVVSQIELKRGADLSEVTRFRDETLKSLIQKLFINKHVIIGASLCLISLINWIVILTKLDLSFAYPAISANYFVVALVSKFYFRDHVSWKRWLSIAIIMLGIIILAMGSL